MLFRNDLWVYTVHVVFNGVPVYNVLLLGPVVQNFISLTSLLRPQLVKYMQYTVIFCITKDSHILSTKNNRVFVIFMFKIFTNR